MSAVSAVSGVQFPSTPNKYNPRVSTDGRLIDPVVLHFYFLRGAVVRPHFLVLNASDPQKELK